MWRDAAGENIRQEWRKWRILLPANDARGREVTVCLRLAQKSLSYAIDSAFFKRRSDGGIPMSRRLESSTKCWTVIPLVHTKTDSMRLWDAACSSAADGRRDSSRVIWPAYLG